VVLAGDAAHQMPPFMGQGFNSGIRDAANLAWRLALLVDGKGRESLLDDYAAERGTQVVQIVEQTVLIGQMFCMTDPEECAQRDAALHEPGELNMQEASQNWLLRGGTLQDDGIGGSLGLQATVARILGPRSSTRSSPAKLRPVGPGLGSGRPAVLGSASRLAATRRA